MPFLRSSIKTLVPAMIVLALSSCVPQAVEKKAVCGADKVFSSVSRSCVASEARSTPVGTKNSDTLSEETPKTITLSYTDKNKDSAVSCLVTSISSKLEMVSPLVVSGGIFDKGDEVYLAASALATSIPAGVDTAAANAAQAAMLAALTAARGSFYYATVVAQLATFAGQAEILLTLAQNYPGDSAVQANYFLTNARMDEFSPLETMVANRCECTGGVCTTVAVPKLNKSQAAGFSYAITDIDGQGGLKPVSLTIAPMSTSTAHLKPTAASSYHALTESNTSTPTDYSITLAGGGDLAGTAPSSYRYYFTGTKNGSNQGVTSAGIVTNCMDLAGSSGLSDTTCTYRPNSGDAFDSAVVARASAVIGDLTFSALSEGAVGNNFTVQYFNLQDNLESVDSYVTQTEKFGLISPTYNESFVRVEGNALKIFINPGTTSSANIRDLVNAHPQAARLVSVAGGGAGVFPSPSALTPAAVSLAGGVSGFDSIPYLANNVQTNSANDAQAMIKISSADDVPVMNFVASTSATQLEDTVPVTINLSTTFSDVDTDDITYFNTCNVDPADAVFLANFTVNSCTCVLSVCTLSLNPGTDVSSTTPFTFNYRIGSFDGVTTNYTAYRPFSLTMTPVNDAPQLSTVALTLPIVAIPDATVPEGGSAFVDVFIGPGGSGFETSQTLTLTATSSDTTILPDANIVIGDVTPVAIAGKKRITYTPAAYQSGVVTITVKLKDNGGTTNGGVDEFQDTFDLTVTFVDNAPVFLSSITKVETNEGGAVQSDGFQVDEDQGSTADEDPQQMSIVSLSSDNSSVLPDSAIRVFYDENDNGVEDTGEERPGPFPVNLESVAATDAKLHKFYLKLDPVDGIAGNANVSVIISDGTSTASSIFSLVVYPIAALHGGWANISATGLKTDKSGAPVSKSAIVCAYNKTTDLNDCAGANCTGTSAPNGSVTPDAANVIYWDSANEQCYRSTAASAFAWVELKTACPITRATGVCSGENCIGAVTPVGNVTPTAVDQYYFNSATNECFVSNALTNADWEVYVPASVTLEWKTFSLVGSGSESGVQISGWSIFRREAGEDYNFKTGHLRNLTSTAAMSITDPNARSFVDTTAIAGKVYYYVVRPVENKRGFPTYTPEVFSEVRVVAPPANYAFVHRWMMNQEVCTAMNMTTTTSPGKIHPAENFRCDYYGPGESAITPGYYDIGKDLLVDINEMGCPYTVSPACSSNGCVGIIPPSTAEVDGTIYYNRGSGTCYIRDGGAWVTMDAADKTAVTSEVAIAAAKFNTTLNAPLVNISEAQAEATCAARPAPTTGLTAGGGLPNAVLPEKKEYIAYAAHPTGLTDTQIADLEQGFSLDIQSRCNGSSANGLSSAYTDSSIPSTSFIYSLPGSASSGIRSLYTGSIPWVSNKGTGSCVSRYGAQDVYGNVSEWVKDSMSCTSSNFVCNALPVTDMYYDFSGSLDVYGFDYTTGPFNDSNASSSADPEDGFLTDWTFADELFNAGKFSFPLALPINSDIATTYSGIDALNNLLDIGPSSGITTSKLHEDGMYVNGAMHTLDTTKAEAVRTDLLDFIDLQTHAINTLALMETAGWNVGTTDQVAAYALAVEVYDSVAAVIAAFPAVTAAVNAKNASAIAEALRTAASTDPTQQTAAAAAAAQAMGYVVETRALLNQPITALQSAAITSSVTAESNLDAALVGALDGGVIETSADAAMAISNALDVPATLQGVISTAAVDANLSTTATVNIAVGGSYLAGARAGRYTSEMIMQGSTRPDVGFRCIIPIDSTKYPADTDRHPYVY